MSGKQGRIRRAVQAAISDENLDLYILALVATAFTVLGVTGLSDVKTLSSVVLALLAFLALSQIKSRKLRSWLAGGTGCCVWWAGCD